MKTRSKLLDLEDRIDLYVKGVLTQKQIDHLWVDVIQHDYLDYMKTAATLRKLSVGRNVTPIPLMNRERIRMAATAAAAAVIIGVGTSMYFLTGSDSAAEFRPLATVEYSLMRSAEVSSDEFEASLRDVTVLALDGNTASAESRLNSLLESELTLDQRSRTQLSLAALNYNSKNYADAIALFAVIIDTPGTDPSIREKSTWYAANALIHQNRLKEADLYLDQVIQMDGEFKRAAINAKDQLRR